MPVDRETVKPWETWDKFSYFDNKFNAAHRVDFIYCSCVVEEANNTTTLIVSTPGVCCIHLITTNKSLCSWKGKILYIFSGLSCDMACEHTIQRYIVMYYGYIFISFKKMWNTLFFFCYSFLSHNSGVASTLLLRGSSNPRKRYRSRASHHS